MTADELNALPVHSEWAFSGDAERSYRENRETLRRVREVCVMADEPVEGKVTVSHGAPGYAHVEYRVLSNPIGLDGAHVALFCDKGNLCFGYRAVGGIISVYTD